MHLTIDPLVLDRFPGVVLGVVVARGVDNSGASPEATTLLRAAEAGLAARFGSTPVPEHPAIAPWREAYRAFGAKPKDHPSSIENLVRRVLKGNPLPTINPLVDLYNAISLEFLLPVGGEDLDSLCGDLCLTFASEMEPTVRLLGEAEERAPKPGEVIYRDDLGAVCRRWNWKEAERTKLTAETRNAVLVLEALPPVERSVLEAATGRLRDLVARHCGGEVRAALIDHDYPSAHLGAQGTKR